MPELNTLLLFIAASAGLAIAPGPDNIFVLTQSALHGKRTGILVTIGLCTGLIVHTFAVAMGVATLIKTSALAFNALKVCGAVYLLYLAYQLFFANETDLEASEQEDLSVVGKLIGRGFIMNVTNPKVAIFFLAFLPQFIDPLKGSTSLQICLLGFLFMLTAFVVFTAIAAFSGKIGAWLRESKGAQIVINRVAGCIFVLLAIRLLLTQL